MIDNYQHNATRPHTPSIEEAGDEQLSPILRGMPGRRDIPRNPIVERGQDPELFWLEKYGADNREAHTHVDIRPLYRSEHVDPECLIRRLASVQRINGEPLSLFGTPDTFDDMTGHEELEKVAHYYTQADGWRNRLILGDSLLVMTSLLEIEGFASSIQTVYIDPPYGIRYGSNWQMKMGDRTMPESEPDSYLSGEPEVIRAYRDTWELGIHSYLGYLRDRLVVARDLLADSGSCFIQISDENVHLVRCLMDEVFGSGNFVAEILVKKKGSQKGGFVQAVNDYVLWYGKSSPDSGLLKFRSLFEKREIDAETLNEFNKAELPDGTIINVRAASGPDGEEFDYRLSPQRLFVDYPKARLFRANPLTVGGIRSNQSLPYTYKGVTFAPPPGSGWKTTAREVNGNPAGMDILAEQGRLISAKTTFRFKSYLDDFGYTKLSNWWDSMGGASDPLYVVQTNPTIIQRCILMTSDPGDLVLDPTCGSGTTAFVAEQWGRRWITVDSSRVALNIARTRITTATFPWYRLHDPEDHDLKQGFVYKTVPHVTLGSIANNEPPVMETLFDQPEIDRRRMRVAGAFTVETLQSYDTVAPEETQGTGRIEDSESFEQLIYNHLRAAGIKNGYRNETAVFTRVEPLTGPHLHAVGTYMTPEGEKRAYFHIGPRFAAVTRNAVNESIKAMRPIGRSGESDWLVVLGFAFENNMTEVTGAEFKGFRCDIIRMHDDLMQSGLLKGKDSKAAAFITIGKPDVRLHSCEDSKYVQVEIAGLDLYDPIANTVKERNTADIAFWTVDDDYHGTDFIARQLFFCGGEQEEFKRWRKGLDDLAKVRTKRKTEQALRVEIDDEAFDRLYGHISHPILATPGRKIAVRVTSQFGEESTTVLTVE